MELVASSLVSKEYRSRLEAQAYKLFLYKKALLGLLRVMYTNTGLSMRVLVRLYLILTYPPVEYEELFKPHVDDLIEFVKIQIYFIKLHLNEQSALEVQQDELKEYRKIMFDLRIVMFTNTDYSMRVLRKLYHTVMDLLLDPDLNIDQVHKLIDVVQMQISFVEMHIEDASSTTEV
jgi:hypothetical protein